MAMVGRFPAVASVVALALLGGCGGGGGGDKPAGEAACGRDTEEPLDPRSTQHLLPGSPEPEYSSDPPTSGPHLAGDVPGGAQRRPLTRPAQVAVLERGGIVIQYRDAGAGADAAARRGLEALAGADVVTAPNPDLPDEVVATAWRRRLVCSRAGEREVAALEAFVEAHRGKGPEG